MRTAIPKRPNVHSCWSPEQAVIGLASARRPAWAAPPPPLLLLMMMRTSLCQLRVRLSCVLWSPLFTGPRSGGSFLGL